MTPATFALGTDEDAGDHMRKPGLVGRHLDYTPREVKHPDGDMEMRYEDLDGYMETHCEMGLGN